MGISMSTLAGWTVLTVVFGFYYYTSRPQVSKVATQARRQLEHNPVRKDTKDKAKHQRSQAFKKDDSKKDDSNKTVTQPKAVTKSSTRATESSDDDVNNKEFARQLASVKQGTNLNAPKKSEEKKQKSVKQSRAQIIDETAVDSKISAPSSTAGADADDDESPIASPEVAPADAGDVTDMLEPKSAGPAVLRLTDTDKVKKKEKKAKAPEKVETKKQRQNRQKAEAAKAAREETEKESATGEFIPVQPLDTFDTSSRTDVPAKKATPPAPAPNKTESWMSSLPSEEEQLEILRGQEESWSTVTTKKSKGKKKDATTETQSEAENSEAKPAKAAPVASQPAVTPAPKAPVNGNGKPAKRIHQQSSFAALSVPDDEEEVEQEWDV